MCCRTIIFRLQFTIKFSIRVDRLCVLGACMRVFVCVLRCAYLCVCMCVFVSVSIQFSGIEIAICRYRQNRREVATGSSIKCFYCNPFKHIVVNLDM